MTAARVWYVAYGSNMCAARLRYYLAGGRPPGAARVYPGCRDTRPPARDAPVSLPGGVYFALRSRVWGGGLAFYDPSLRDPRPGDPRQPGLVPARAYLITAGQFADLAAQEMGRAPGTDLDLAPLRATGRHQLGPGRYETLVGLGTRDGWPMLTMTAPWSAGSVEPTAPAAIYLRMLATGLAESHGWSPARIAGYLAARPGAQGTWSVSMIADLLAEIG
ncbi:MAG: histone deacetylase [Frankia sp.]